MGPGTTVPRCAACGEVLDPPNDPHYDARDERYHCPSPPARRATPTLADEVRADLHDRPHP